MSKPFVSESMDVVTLEDGRYGVQITRMDALPQILGHFETRQEADAWVLQQSMLEDEAGMDNGIVKPGPSLDVV